MVQTITMAMLGLSLPPALFIVWSKRRDLLHSMWRKPEVSIVLAFLLDAVRRLMILSVHKSPVTAWYWGVAAFISLGALAFALWGQAIQIIRHDRRNREMKEAWRRELGGLS